MRRFILLVSLIASGIALLTPFAPASAASYQFVLGFKPLQDQIPTLVGDCLVDEHHNATNGDALQDWLNTTRFSCEADTAG